MADATQILINLSDSLGPVSQLISGAAYLIGISFAFKALYHLKIYGELRTMMSSNTSFKEPMAYLFVAAIFIFLPTGVSLIMSTTFGYANPLAYSEWPSAGGTSVSPGMIAVFRLVQVIGLIAFIRGWIFIVKSQGQGAQGGFGKGLTHIFGGIAGMNIIGTAQVISATLGINF